MSKANALTTEHKLQIKRIEAYMKDEADTISTKNMTFLKSNPPSAPPDVEFGPVAGRRNVCQRG